MTQERTGHARVHVPVHPRVVGAPSGSGSTGTDDRPRTAAAPLDRHGPVRLALVANGKPNSLELLEALADELRVLVPALEVRAYRKPSVSVPPDPVDAREIVGWANAVLAALGD